VEVVGADPGYGLLVHCIPRGSWSAVSAMAHRRGRSSAPLWRPHAGRGGAAGHQVTSASDTGPRCPVLLYFMGHIRIEGMRCHHTNLPRAQRAGDQDIGPRTMSRVSC
jgi:hypothetical protein